MSSTDPQSIDEWKILAQERLADAEHALKGKRWTNAYDMAGIALECALKGAIMRHERLNCWPDRSSRAELYNHRLLKLLELSDLEAKMVTELQSFSQIGMYWKVAQVWKMQRYAKPTPAIAARDMVHAARALIDWIAL